MHTLDTLVQFVNFITLCRHLAALGRYFLAYSPLSPVARLFYKVFKLGAEGLVALTELLLEFIELQGNGFIVRGHLLCFNFDH